MVKALIYVFVGGGVGSVLRYLTSVLVGRYNTTVFPFATLAVNLIGCLLIGLFVGWLHNRQPDSNSYFLLLVTGFCGGYTTFSTFALENFRLIGDGHVWLATLYVAASVLIGLLAVLGGMWLTNKV